MRSVRYVSSMMSILVCPTVCACCSSVNQQKKEKMNVYVLENTLKLRRKSALRGEKILNEAKYPQKHFANVVKYTTRWLS